jgi:hypothetical protein
LRRGRGNALFPFFTPLDSEEASLFWNRRGESCFKVLMGTSYKVASLKASSYEALRDVAKHPTTGRTSKRHEYLVHLNAKWDKIVAVHVSQYDI